jgi:apolipoprotein N-acyltransferase
MHRFLTTRLAAWLALPLGAAVSLAFAPFGWWPLGILGTAYLFAVWHDAAPRRAALTGFLFTSGTFLAGTYWLYHSVYEIGRAPIALTIFVIVAIAGIMGLYTAAVGYVLARWVRVQGALRCLVVLPAAIAVLEWFRGWFLSGFPWLALGYTQTDAPLAGFAPIVGVYGVSFAVTLTAGALVALLLGSPRTRIAAASAGVVVWVLGFALWSHEWTQPTGQPVTVALVQGAVPQELKWDQAQFEATLELYRKLTAPHLGAGIIVWPESALAAPVHMLGGFLGPEWDAAKRSGSTLVLGQLRFAASHSGPRNPPSMCTGAATSTTTPSWHWAASRSGTRSDGSCRWPNSFPCRISSATGCRAWSCRTAASKRVATRNRHSMRRARSSA